MGQTQDYSESIKYIPKLEWLNGSLPVSYPLSDQTKLSVVEELISGAFLSKLGPPENCDILAQGEDSLGHPYAVLGLPTNHGWDCTLVLLSADKSGRQVIGTIALTNQKAWAPEVSYVDGSPGALVLTHLHGYGSGFFRRSTAWYLMSTASESPIISYPHSFQVSGWGMPFDRTLTSKVLDFPVRLRAGANLTLLFQINYDIPAYLSFSTASELLFSSTVKLSFEWSPEAQVFLPSTPSDDLSKVEAAWGDGMEEFIAHNRNHLIYLAQFGSVIQKTFIRDHLMPEAESELKKAD